MGKTSFALGIATHVASVQKRPVAYFALQESREGLLRRILTSEARVSNHALRRGVLDDESLARLATAAGYLNGSPIYLQDGIWDLIALLEAMRRARAEHKIELFVVDPIQMVSVPALHGLSRDQEVGHVTRELKRFALREDVPVMVCSSLSRQPDTRYDRRPAMTDPRDSGEIENTADHLLLLYRPEYYFGPHDKAGNSLQGQAELILNKQRTGFTEVIRLVWIGDFTRFEAHAPLEED
jgi:replicative DNA helicase